MKLHNIFYSAAMAALAIAMSSCSNIDENERLIEVEKPQANRAVLIEDFTGQWCPNCPNAADELEQLTETYGSDAIVGVAIHSGPQGFQGGTDDMPGLMTDLGNEYYNHFGIEYQPQGLVDRGGKLAYSAWAAAVRSELQKVALLDIHIDNDYSATTRKLTINTKVNGVKGTGTIANCKLQVWLIEDGIKSIQIMPDGSYNQQYILNHVLRDAVNGTWGENVVVTEDTDTENTYTYDIPDNWNADNVSVVAFVYDSNGVQQVVKKAIVAKK